ncbi:MAG: tRNA pseudouridine(13) synthase TruD, partial [Rhabdochlamydiaceae bacterium]
MHKKSISGRRGDIEALISRKSDPDFGGSYNLYWDSKMRVELFGSEDDFIVREMIGGRALRLDKSRHRKMIKKGPFVHFTLIKSGVSTYDAINKVARYFGIPGNEVGYCGMKDTYAVTAQRISLPYTKGMKSQYKIENFVLTDGTPA